MSINTASKLLVKAGKACFMPHDEMVRDVKASRFQCVKIWSFCHANERDIAVGNSAPESAGNV